MTQNDWILQSLKQAPLTALQALEGCGCFRLAARINDLRAQGHKINTVNLKLENNKTIAQYHLENTYE